MKSDSMPQRNEVVLVIDQGTTSTRVIGFGVGGETLATSQVEHKQHYPQPDSQGGWVEHDPEEIWQNAHSCLTEVYNTLVKAGHTPKGIGITNQRETVVAWDKKTGEVLYNAIVWQDKRTADYCARLSASHGIEIRNKTGLPTDPYFSGSKMHWLLQNVAAVQKANKENTLAFGTIDSFLLWRLTGGKEHLTDSTNACRTLLFNIHKMAWSEELTGLFGVPRTTLPEVHPNTADFGTTAKDILPRQLPIAAMAGDQHAATFGQACFKKGMVKSTYGTGCFAVLNTGHAPVPSENGLLTTLAYHVGDSPTFGLEGSIFVAGAGVQWLRDQLGLLKNAAETEALAKQADGKTEGLYMVPAFAGLGAPWWDSRAKGTIVGMTLGTDKSALTHAMLEAVCYQSHDLFAAMAADSGTAIQEVRVDGGMVINNWLCQRLSDLTEKPIRRPDVTETTALGVAWMAGLQLGLYENTDQLSGLWQKEAGFEPAMAGTEVEKKRQGWHNAVQTTRSHKA